MIYPNAPERQTERLAKAVGEEEEEEEAMAKSLRSKKEKRLRAIRREMVEPYYDNKDTAKLASQEAALAAPRLAARPTSANTDTTTTSNAMHVEIADRNQSMHSLKPAGGIGKKFKRKFKMGKGKCRG